MAGGNVEIKFVADSSDLRAELGKVATSLDDVADSTQGATNDMRKGLDGAKKSAEGLAKKVPSVAGGAKTAGAALKQTGASAAEASDKLSHMEGAAGQASSSMSGLAGALSLVSPEAGAAAQGLAGLAGGLEGAARGGSRVFAILGPVALAVTAAGAAYSHFKAELDAANEALETQRAKLETVQDMHRKVKDAALLSALANKEITQTEFDAISAAQSAADLTRARRQLLVDEKNALDQKRMVLEAAALAEHEHSAALRESAQTTNFAFKSGGNYNAAVGSGTVAVQNRVEALREVNRKTDETVSKLMILDVTEIKYAKSLTDSKAKIAEKSVALTEAAEVEAEINDGRLAALEQLAAIDEAKQMSMLEGAELLQAQADAELEQIATLQAAYLNDAQVKTAADKAREAVNAAGIKKIRKLQSAAAAAAEAESQRFDVAEDARIMRRQQQNLSVGADLAASTAQLFGAMSSTIGEEDEQAARILFQLWKGMSIAHIGLKTAEGLMTAAALPPPLSGIKSASVMIASAASLMLVASTPAPFHSGSGMVKAPDRTNEINARLRAGEAVSTPLGAETIGRGTIEAANAGVPIGGGSAPTVFMYEHRAFTRFIRDNVRGVSGGLADEINSGRAIGQRAIGR